MMTEPIADERVEFAESFTESVIGKMYMEAIQRCGTCTTLPDSTSLKHVAFVCEYADKAKLSSLKTAITERQSASTIIYAPVTYQGRSFLIGYYKFRSAYPVKQLMDRKIKSVEVPVVWCKCEGFKTEDCLNFFKDSFPNANHVGNVLRDDAEIAHLIRTGNITSPLDLLMACQLQHDRAAKWRPYLTNQIRFNSTRIADRKIILIWGCPEKGKTKSVYDLATASDMEVYPVLAGADFWQGYTNQDIVLYNDLDPRKKDTEFFKTKFDKQTVWENQKNGGTHVTAKIIAVTTNHPPEIWGEDKDMYAILRRFTEVIHHCCNGKVYGTNAAQCHMCSGQYCSPVTGKSENLPNLRCSFEYRSALLKKGLSVSMSSHEREDMLQKVARRKRK